MAKSEESVEDMAGRSQKMALYYVREAPVQKLNITPGRGTEAPRQIAR